LMLKTYIHYQTSQVINQDLRLARHVLN